MFLSLADFEGLSGRKSRNQLNQLLASQGISVPKFLNQMTPEQQAQQALLKQQQEALAKAGLPTIKVAAGETTMTPEQAAALQAAGLPTTMTANIGTKSTASAPGPAAPAVDPLQAVKDRIAQWQAECASKGGQWDPTQGSDVPGYGKTGSCYIPPAPAPLPPQPYVDPYLNTAMPASPAYQQPAPVQQQPAPVQQPYQPAPQYSQPSYPQGGGYDQGGDEEMPQAPAPVASGPAPWVYALGGVVVLAAIGGAGYYFFVRKPAAAAAAQAAAPTTPASAPAVKANGRRRNGKAITLRDYRKKMKALAKKLKK